MSITIKSFIYINTVLWKVLHVQYITLPSATVFLKCLDEVANRNKVFKKQPSNYCTIFWVMRVPLILPLSMNEGLLSYLREVESWCLVRSFGENESWGAAGVSHESSAGELQGTLLYNKVCERFQLLSEELEMVSPNENTRTFFMWLGGFGWRNVSATGNEWRLWL